MSGLDPFDQHGYDVRFEWGPNGLRRLAPGARAVVIVDVLRFTTVVSVAVGRGVAVLPYRWHDDGATAFAASHAARLDETISPSAMAMSSRGDRVVVPSPNGSALSFGVRERAPDAMVLAGCLRNAIAVGEAAIASDGDGHIAVIAAGERWRGGTGPLRPALEDLLGSGAVIAAMEGVTPSPEATSAAHAFTAVAHDLGATVLGCSSGRELVERGLRADVVLAADLDAERVAPRLIGDAFVA